MHTLTDEQLADARSRLHDLMMGFARVESSELDPLIRGNWAVAAQLELLRRHPLVGVLDDEVLAAIACRAIDPNVEAQFLSRRLQEVDAEERAEQRSDARSEGNEALASRDLPAAAVDQMEATIALIAKGHLGFATLELRGRDHLDFRDCGVAGVRAALVEAYVEGWHAAG